MKSHRKPGLRTWRFAPLVGIFAVINFVIALVEPRGQITGGIVLGLVFAQVAALAVWSALGPVSVFSRVATGLVLAVVVALSLFACIHQGGGGDEPIVLSAVVLATWLAIQVPLWAVRLIAGWHLCWAEEEHGGSSRDEMQFGVGQLLIWTALVGVTLGLGRWLVPGDVDNSFRDVRVALGMLGVLTVFNVLLALPVIWSSFVSSWVPVWFVTAAVCFLGLTVAEISVFRAATGMTGVDEGIFWLMNAIQFAAAAVCLLFVRACGLRLAHLRS